MKKTISIKRYIMVFILVVSLSISMISNANTVISNENWDDWQDENYWEWHTRTTSRDKAYNGQHIKIENNAIAFYGYGQTSYKDFLYKEYSDAGTKKFKFIIDESKANYHTLDGAGFLFNASKRDGLITGYIVLFTEKDVCIYRIENVNVEELEITRDRKISNYGEMLTKVDKSQNTKHDLEVEASPSRIIVRESDEEIINWELDESKHVGESFGTIVSYAEHNCEILTKIEFSQLQLAIEDYGGKIINIDESGSPISGGVFDIFNENEELVKTQTGDENGEVSISGLPKGLYAIKQKTPPAGYAINPYIYTFTITEGGKIVSDYSQDDDLKIQNGLPKLVIRNKDEDTKQVIAGSIIGLYDANGNPIAQAYTDSSGNATFEQIPTGTYIYKQLSVPPEYDINQNQFEITIDENGNPVINSKDDGIVYNKKKNSNNNNSNNNNNNSNNSNNSSNNSNNSNNNNNSNNSNNNNNSNGSTQNTTIKTDTTLSGDQMPKSGIEDSGVVYMILISLALSYGVVSIVKLKKLKNV